MARIIIDEIGKKDKSISLQKVNKATYSISQKDDDCLFQIDTYSDNDDQHVTQCIQFDKENLVKLLKLISKEFQSFDIPLLDNKGEVKYGINWGNRSGRDTNQAYLDLSPEIYNSNYFPTNGEKFIVRTDDGQNITFTRAQKDNINGHALQTPDGNDILGIYLRNRLSVEKGKVITKEDIERYGRAYITISKIGDFYFLDFSNKEKSSRKEQNKTILYSNYRPYITAIKSKPFLLLAGISGTGKSRIVRELAKACWGDMEGNKPKNFEMVQVKPNWHDSSELIGYVSRVSGRAEFIAGPFLKFIAKAWADPSHPYFLCLDEMNLAPVEQYFAEYLSVIESRKTVGDEVVTDPILNKDGEDWFRVLTETLAGDHTLRVQFLQKGISIPQNLIVVGTVNMDETTFSFSRKVLDRAMTIEMNEVDLRGGLDNKNEIIGSIDFDAIVGTAVEGVDVYSDNKEVCDQAIGYLSAINEKLEGTPFKIAYRTRNEVLLYVVNNLPYNKDEKNNEIPQNKIVARALDEITNMKILSRIEGDETKVSKSFLDGLEKTIKEGISAICNGLFDENTPDESYSSVSLSKLDEMRKRLVQTGYTSCWS